MDQDQVKQQFEELLTAKQLDLSAEQWERFELYYRELVDWNERMNLTAITDREQVFVKHFYDSISLSFYVPLQSIASMADIGSGAGFPSIPLKIMFPHLKVTIVDSLNKRIGFLNALVTRLGLSDVSCLHGRAEDVARKSEHRDQYDLVTARAVARLSVLNEFCLPFVKTGGLFAAMKGSDLPDELKEAKISLRELKGEVEASHQFELPVEHSTRHIVCIRKKAATPAKYPRKAGTPLKQPLV
ncbi:16S rRNA (guanine(527)-N(7))-methyltransferase RsmG [Paenibacillus koleovorans]|uniref:16S rRNA (guanine(527)-N(7))-methyltransferase RsmG n=1 Tax=Paenibacillus koleovorans TaxID=121608 RepID=UPI000FDC9AE8|nr:16S rRNA (guanine(527)-N(7))-methyltransferase RsmG [Paenibacillus koleovorans]